MGFDFTLREKMILKRVSVGMMNAEIAEDLFISPLTVSSHIKNIYRKLDDNGVNFSPSYAVAKRLMLLLWVQKWFRDVTPRIDIRDVPLNDFF